MDKNKKHACIMYITFSMTIPMLPYPKGG